MTVTWITLDKQHWIHQSHHIDYWWYFSSKLIIIVNLWKVVLQVCIKHQYSESFIEFLQKRSDWHEAQGSDRTLIPVKANVWQEKKWFCLLCPLNFLILIYINDLTLHPFRKSILTTEPNLAGMVPMWAPFQNDVW